MGRAVPHLTNLKSFNGLCSVLVKFVDSFSRRNCTNGSLKTTSQVTFSSFRRMKFQHIRVIAKSRRIKGIGTKEYLSSAIPSHYASIVVGGVKLVVKKAVLYRVAEVRFCDDGTSE